MKTCTACKTERDDFSPDKRASDGLQGRCRECSTKAQKAARERNVELARTKRRNYYARESERVLATNQKWRDENRPAVLEGKRAWYERVKGTPKFTAKVSEYQARTKDEKREYDREYRARNPELQTRRATEWRRNNPDKRKAIMRQYSAKRRTQEEAGITGGMLAAWTLEQPKVCFYCDVDCAGSFHVDHFMPLAKGGAHVLTNLRIACPPCNLRKNARDPMEFMERAA